MRLLVRIIDAQHIDAGDARLHLHLRIMNARFVIQKFARKMQGRFAPVVPALIA